MNDNLQCDTIHPVAVKMYDLIFSLLARKTVNYHLVCNLTLLIDEAISKCQNGVSPRNVPDDMMEN